MSEERTYNLLIIGVGGIGIEMIKLLSLYSKILENKGLKKITIVDNDIIELSNLNRQFIFMKTDLGNYKSEVAKIFLKKHFSIQIKSITQKVQYDPGDLESGNDCIRFDTNFFKNYDFIFNCLDNLETRQFISRRVVICNKTLRRGDPITIIDGGTAGLQGQVRVFTNESCYDCLNIQKRTEIIPVCTIKGKPEKFEHCLVWAINKVDDLKTDLLENKFINLKEFSIENFLREEKDVFLNSLESEIYALFKTKNVLNILESLNNKKFKNKLIYFLSVKRCFEFDIKKKLTFMETESQIDQIIPSLSTINAIISSLMLKNFLFLIRKDHFKDYFVTGSKILKAKTTEQNPNCLFCNNKLLLISKPHCDTKESIKKKIRYEQDKIMISNQDMSEIKDFLNVKGFYIQNLEDNTFSVEVKKSFEDVIFLSSNQIYLIQANDTSCLFVIEKADEFNLQLF